MVEVDDSCTAEHEATAPPLRARGNATTGGARFPNSGAAEHLHAAWPAGALSPGRFRDGIGPRAGARARICHDWRLLGSSIGQYQPASADLAVSALVSAWGRSAAMVIAPE